MSWTKQYLKEKMCKVSIYTPVTFLHCLLSLAIIGLRWQKYHCCPSWFLVSCSYFWEALRNLSIGARLIKRDLANPIIYLSAVFDFQCQNVVLYGCYIYLATWSWGPFKVEEVYYRLSFCKLLPDSLCNNNLVNLLNCHRMFCVVF